MTPTVPLRRSLLVASFLSVLLATAGHVRAEDEIMPGAKLLHKFPKEVYRMPLLSYSGASPVLIVWVDEKNPRIQDIKNVDVTKIGPSFDLVFWDVSTGKDLTKIPFKKDGPALPYAPLDRMGYKMCSDATGTTTLTPDHKSLVFSVMVELRPGMMAKEAIMEVKSLDLESLKESPTNGKKYGGLGSPYVLHAADGSLVMLHGEYALIFEPGKSKVRKSLKLPRERFQGIGPIGAINAAAVNADASKLAVAMDGKVVVYDVASGRVIYQPTRTIPEDKNGKNPLFMREAELVFSGNGEKLFVLENTMGAYRQFTQCRVLDLKAKKETSKVMIADNQNKVAVGAGGGMAESGLIYFTPNKEPRVISGKSVLDGTNGKELYKINPGLGVYVTHDGKYLVRVVASADDAKKWLIESWSLENVK